MFEVFYDAKLNMGEVPLHNINDREYWESLSPYADKLLCDYPKEICPLTASVYMEFKNNGNRLGYEHPYFSNRTRLREITVLEAIRNNGDLLADIVDGVWAMLDEFTWCVPAHNGFGWYGEADSLPDPDDYVLDLFQAETGALLAEVYYMFKDKFSEISVNIGKRIEKDLRERVIWPFVNREYNYMGFNRCASTAVVDNWNPWITSNVLFVALVLGDGSVISKAAKTLDNYVSLIGEDGGCDEGPLYWFKAGGKLVEAAEYLRLLTGIDITSNEKLKNCAEFNIKSNLFGNVFANFADASPYVYLIGGYYVVSKITGSEDIYNFGRSVYEYTKKMGGDFTNIRTDTVRMIVSTLEAMMDFEENKREFAHSESYYVESIQTKSFHKGEYDVAVKAGHNDERHNHNDVGNFIIAKNKEIFIIDVGAKDYSKDTFSENRYKIWVNSSDYHNLPEISGTSQKQGKDYKARNIRNIENGFCQDIAPAYEGEGILKWERTLLVDEGRIDITEDFEYEDEKEAVIHLMTQFKPQKEEYGFSLASKTGAKMEVHFSGDFTYDEIETKNDTKLSASWGECVYRINIPIEKTKAGKFEYYFI